MPARRRLCSLALTEIGADPQGPQYLRVLRFARSRLYQITQTDCAAVPRLVCNDPYFASRPPNRE